MATISPTTVSNEQLCTIAQVDCKHDFGEEARGDYSNIDQGCPDVTYDEDTLTDRLLSMYSNYQCYFAHEGSPRIIHPRIPIRRESPLSVLGGLEKLPIVCDFTVGIFHKDRHLKTLRDKVIWIENNETLLDPAPKSTYDFPAERMNNTITFLPPNDSNIRSETLTNESRYFYLSKYTSATMMGNEKKSFVAFVEDRKRVFMVDRDYCKNNGMINKLITKPPNNILKVMESCRLLLNGTIGKQGCQFLKYIAKRLGDQGQAISALRKYKGSNCIFVTHDRVARDFAISIGVPYIVWTYSGPVDKGYYLFVNQNVMSPEALESRRMEVERERSRVLEIKRKIVGQIAESKNRIKTELKNYIERGGGEEYIKDVLFQIIPDVYFLDTFVNKIKTDSDIEKLNLNDIVPLEIPTIKNRLENFTLTWSVDRLNNSSVNIFGIKNTYLCADILLKIKKILEDVDDSDGGLHEMYITFLRKLREFVDMTPVSSSRNQRSYKENVMKTLKDIIGGFIRSGGNPFGRKDTTKIEENFFEVDEDMHASLYLLIELVNMFQEHINYADPLFRRKIRKFLPILYALADKPDNDDSMDIDRRVSRMEPEFSTEDEYQFTLPFEFNTTVQENLDKFFELKNEVETLSSEEVRKRVGSLIDTIFLKIEDNIQSWKENYDLLSGNVGFSAPPMTGKHGRRYEETVGRESYARKTARNAYIDDDVEMSTTAGGRRRTRKNRLRMKISRNSKSL